MAYGELILAVFCFQVVKLQTLSTNLPDRIPFFVLHCNVYCNGTEKKYIKAHTKITPWCMDCNCDKKCDTYGSCCPDIYGNIRSLKNNGVRCVATHAQNNETLYDNSGHFMISTCPKSCDSPNSNNEQEWGPNDNPVTSLVTNAVYKNAHIAQCNHQFSFAGWTKEVICNKINMTENSTHPDLSSCTISYLPPTSIPSTLRKCDVLINAENVISECNVTGKWRYYHDAIAYNCKYLNFPVSDRNGQFRNIYCYMCNGFSVEKSGYVRLTPKYTWSSVYDVLLCTRCDQTPVSCSTDQWYDSVRKICRNIYCGEGKLLKQGKCDLINLATNVTGYSYNAMVVLDRNSPGDICDQFITALAYEWAKFLISLKVSQYAMVFEELSSNVKMNGQALSMYLQFKTQPNTPRKPFEKYLNSAFSRHWKIVFNETQNGFLLADYARHQYDIDYTTTFISHPGNGSCCHTIPGIASLPNVSLDSGFLIDITEVYFCASVKLNRSDFNWTDDGSVVLHYANVKLSSGKFYYHQQHEIFVCIEELQKVCKPLLEPSNFDVAKKYISLVCTLLSMACLMLTFLTFCTFPSLRTNASINTIHLVIFLFLAQGFLQFGLTATDNDVMCKIIGILIHYLWLSALLWMNVCSYQMFSVFVLDASKPINVLSNRGRLTKYRIYANGTSALVVAANILFSLLDSDGTQIGYGIGRCYLSSYLRIALAFVLPLALVVTSNIVFFILSVCTISKISRLGESVANGRENIVIYGKLSVFTGMFWIFALISEVADEGRNIISLLSILLNGTQGVFIFLSYTANRRVFELWKWKMTVRLPVRNQSRSTLNTTL